VSVIRVALEGFIAGLAALGAFDWIVWLTEPGQPSPIWSVSACPPCPTTADNAKLREAHAMCDQRAKEWERRALKGPTQ
jgi:hypothetical protein